MPENSALDLRAMQEQNRAALMNAITRRNDLHVEVERLEQRTATLEREATEALRDGNRGTAKLRLQAKVAADQELQTRRGELAGIETSVEEVKRSIRDLEDLLKMQPAEAPKPPIFNAPASTEETPPLPNILSDTLDALASGDYDQPLAADISADDAAVQGSKEGNEAQDVTDASPTGLPSAAVNESPQFDAVVAARAQERGVTPEEYQSVLNKRLADLAEYILPLNTAEADEQDDASVSVETILRQAVIDLKENQIRNREYAIRALTYKNNLTSQVARHAKLNEEYSRKALQTLDQGNRELARQFYREKRQHEQILPVMQSLLVQATQAAEQTKERIRQQEERIGARTWKAILLEANLKATAMRFRLETLQEETDLLETQDDDFDAWVHAQRPGSPE